MNRILSKRERIILYVAISVVIFTIVFNLFIAPIIEKNRLLNKEINITRTKLKKYLWLLSQKELIQTRYRKFSSAFKVSDEKTDTLVEILSELESLAKNANIRIVEIRPQTPKTEVFYKQVSIDLRAEGTRESYLKFIYDIENSALLFRIQRFQLNAKPNTAVLEGSFSILQLSTPE